MVTSMKDAICPKVSLQKGKVVVESSRQTRATKKVVVATEQEEIEANAKLSSATNVRRKAQSQVSHPLKGKKKGNPVSPAVMDVVFGRVHNIVPDVDELCRKREEDAVKCGRIRKSNATKVFHPVNTSKFNVAEERTLQ